jgi:protein-tyrosine phosphatase
MPEAAEAQQTPYVFEGLYNFRDVGGLRIGDHTQTRFGMLYRSDAFADVTVADIDFLLDELEVRRVIDLRADRERDADEVRPFAGREVEYRDRPIDGGIDNAIETAAAGERLAYRYLGYLDHARESVASAVKDLAEPGSPPTIVHCRAGKDRTGVVIAVVLCLLGVDNQTIARDYALTSIGMPKILARLRESALYSANVERLPGGMYFAEETTMVRFLELAAERHGSLEAWALASGITNDEIGKLRANLRTEGESDAR